jgi:3-mercaptopyruvate sulfurtransferase SseA
MRARGALGVVVAAAVLLASAAPAAPPDYPVTFIKVDELKSLLQLGAKAAIIDVRDREAYEASHIQGARSIPLRSVAERAAREIPKNGLVVFY